jgi:hypothetical protein
LFHLTDDQAESVTAVPPAPTTIEYACGVTTKAASYMKPPPPHQAQILDPHEPHHHTTNAFTVAISLLC